MFIPDPGSWFLPIPDPGSRISDPGSKNRNKIEGWTKICCHTFFCSHKFHKIVNYFSFEMLKKKIWTNFQRIIELFTLKCVTKLSTIWVWDPGSGKNLFQIPDPGVTKAPDPGSGSRIRIRNTGSCTTQSFSLSLFFLWKFSIRQIMISFVLGIYLFSLSLSSLYALYPRGKVSPHKKKTKKGFLSLPSLFGSSPWGRS